VQACCGIVPDHIAGRAPENSRVVLKSVQLGARASGLLNTNELPELLVLEDEIERRVEQPAGAHRRLDKPFWKLERCERQLSNLGWRIVFCRHGESPHLTPPSIRLFMLLATRLNREPLRGPIRLRLAP
jgi:hypothetical protein